MRESVDQDGPSLFGGLRLSTQAKRMEMRPRPVKNSTAGHLNDRNIVCKHWALKKLIFEVFISTLKLLIWTKLILLLKLHLECMY